MRRDNVNEMSNMIMSLALRTLWYAVVVGALLIVLFFALFPSAAEDYYTTAGNKPLAYAFAVKATGDNADAARLIKTADKSVSLYEHDDKYAGDVERYTRRLLLSTDGAELLAMLDRQNVLRSPKVLHVNLCDSKGYYSVAMYRARLSLGKTALFLGGNDIEIINLDAFMSTLGTADKDSAYTFEQLALYVAYAAERGWDDKMDKLDVLTTYRSCLNDITGKINVSAPDLESLYVLRAYYKFSCAYYDAAGADIGAIEGISGYDDIKQLYEECLKNYTKTNTQEAYL